MTRRLLLAACAVAASGCAPSVPSLVAERRYADAICHAKTRDDAEATLLALERDLAPRVLVQRAPATSWTTLLGPERGEKAAADLVALRTAWTTNTVSAAKVTGRFYLAVPKPYANPNASEKDRLEGREYAPRAAVAWRLGETPPSQKHEEWTEHLPSPTPRDPLGAFLSLFMPSPSIHHEYVTDPDHDAWLAKAPRTTALWDALEHGTNAQGFVLETKDVSAATLSFVLVVNDARYDGETCDASFWFDLPTTGEAAWRDPARVASSQHAMLANDDGVVTVPP
jgi:hypothetical protein